MAYHSGWYHTQCVLLGFTIVEGKSSMQKAISVKCLPLLSSCLRCCKGVDDSQPILKDDPYNEKLENPCPNPNVYHVGTCMSLDIRLSCILKTAGNFEQES